MIYCYPPTFVVVCLLVLIAFRYVFESADIGYRVGGAVMGFCLIFNACVLARDMISVFGIYVPIILAVGVGVLEAVRPTQISE